VKEKELFKWGEFKEYLNELEGQYGPFHSTKNPALFRGHASSKWNLSTTLERYSDRVWSVTEYLKLTNDCKAKIESLSGRSWILPGEEDAIASIETSDLFRLNLPHENYGYWTYLRHNGFPSPLLDWSASPYIAALFAFHESYQVKDDSRVAIFIFIEKPTGGKAFAGGRPRIHVKGQYVRSHTRHYLQQAHYTVCTQDRGSGLITFVPHTESLKITAKQPLQNEQDVLVKVTLPAKERITVLEDLQKMNINLYSLMNTEEALVKSIAYWEIDQNYRE